MVTTGLVTRKVLGEPADREYALAQLTDRALAGVLDAASAGIAALRPAVADLDGGNSRLAGDARLPASAAFQTVIDTTDEFAAFQAALIYGYTPVDSDGKTLHQPVRDLRTCLEDVKNALVEGHSFHPDQIKLDLRPRSESSVQDPFTLPIRMDPRVLKFIVRTFIFQGLTGGPLQPDGLREPTNFSAARVNITADRVLGGLIGNKNSIIVAITDSGPTAAGQDMQVELFKRPDANEAQSATFSGQADRVLCNTLALAHHATIAFDNTSARGNTYVILLPCLDG